MQRDVPTIKVCFISPKAYPLFNSSVDKVFGGAEVDLYYLSTEIAKDAQFEVSFIVADYGQDDIEQIEGVRVIKSLTFKENPLAGARKVWRAMKTADADIYMLKTASPGVSLARWFCGLNNKLLTYRTASSRECDGTYLKTHVLGGMFFKWALKKAKFVTVQNHNDAEQLKKTIGVESTVIPNGHRIQDAYGVDKDAVLWVGRSAEIKRPGLFVDLAVRCPDQQFIMICQRATGDDNYDKLRSAAREVSNLEFIERVGFKDIDAYFGRAKVFVNTSDSEGFPNTFIQSCKASTPILSLNVNPDNFLNDHNCGICCDGDFEKMVAEVKNLTTGDAGLQMGINGRQYVEQKHDVEKIAGQYKDIFRKLIEAKGSL